MMTNRTVSLILVFAATLTCYMGTLHYPFQFDEEPFFARPDPSICLKDVETIWKFTPARFVTFLTFGVNYWIGGSDTFGYHIVNVSIHALNGAILFWLAGMLAARALGNSGPAPDGALWRFYPLCVSLVFVTHPIQTQAVTYLWQRTGSLCALFYLLSLALYAKSRLVEMDAGRRAWQAPALVGLSVFSGLAASFSKQTAATLPVAIVLLELCFFSGSWGAVKKRVPKLAIFLPLLFVISLLSAFGMGWENNTTGSRAVNVPSHKDYLLTEFNVIVTYIRLLFYPAGQNLDYDYPVSKTFGDSIASLILLAGLLGAAVAMRKRNRIVSFGILFFFLAMSVESSIIPLEDVIFEHRAYLPSAGFIMAVGAALFMAIERIDSRIGSGKVFPATVLLALFLVTGLIIATRARNEVWRGKETLWLDVVKKSPNKLRGYFHLGMYYADKGKTEEAMAWYKKAILINPLSTFAHFKLGKLYDKKGDMDSAISEFTLALKSDPELALAPLYIGDIYMKKGDPRLAYDYYLTALSVSPGLVEAMDGLKKAEAAMDSAGVTGPSAQRAGN
jgi:hypothetical protein